VKKSTNYMKWLNWGILNLAFTLTFFHRFSMSAVTDALSRDLNLSSMQLANLASMYFYAYALMLIPIGILVSKYGGKKVSLLGMISCSIGSILFGTTENIYMLYFFRTLVGIGASTVFISVMDVQTKWFESSKFTKLTGFTSLIGNIGGMCAAAPLAFLVGYMGWKSSFKLIGFVNIIVVALIWFLVKEKPKQEDIKIEEENPILNVKEILLGSKFISIVLLSFSIMGGLMSFQGLWIIPYLKDSYNITNESAASFAMIISVAGILANASIGWIEKIIGSKRKIATLSSLAFTLCLVTMVLLGKYKFIGIIAIFIMGAAGIITFVIGISIAKDLIPGSKSSLGISIVDLAAFTGTIVLNSLTGAVMDFSSSSNLSIGGYSLILFSYLIFVCGSLILFIITSGVTNRSALNLVIKEKQGR
jgi:predicted MFS family arabinose efflux permease